MQMLYSVSAKKVTGDDGLPTLCYGINVIELLSGGCVSIDAITTDRRRAVELANLMSRFSVTPITAYDIVYDWLCENAEL